jgi:hypothetical protein
MPKRQLVLINAAKPADTDDRDGPAGLPPLGDLRHVTSALARYNTAPDGGKPGVGMLTLYGPGLIMEIPTGREDITQVMVTMTDDDFAFPVLTRLCREQRWTMMDPDSGRRFGP